MDFKDVKSPTNITKNDLLSKVTVEEIFGFYFGPFTLKKTYSSPLRKDTKPSFGFYYNSHGELMSHDITKKEKLDCIGFVARLKGINYYEAINLICSDFNICGVEKGSYILNTSSMEDRKQSSIFSDNLKKKTKIQIVKRDFTKEELDYWYSKNKCITKEELEENNIFSIEELYINKVLVPNYKKELRFAFYQQDNTTKKGYFKIYSPYSKSYKWISNIPLSLPFGIDRLEFKSDTLVITKSLKDLIILKKIFTDVIATQNESVSAIERCLDITKLYNRIIIIWDSDSVGVENCKEITEEYNWEYFNTPKYLYEEKGITDITEYVEYFGLESLKKRLKEKKILL